MFVRAYLQPNEYEFSERKKYVIKVVDCSTSDSESEISSTQNGNGHNHAGSPHNPTYPMNGGVPLLPLCSTCR